MEIIARELISTYIAPLTTPGMILVVVASVGMILSGLAAKVVELGHQIKLRTESR